MLMDICEGNTILPCNCAGYDFIDKRHRHILTGNFKRQ